MPTTLSDRYQLHELVGSGAAGRVYRARDLRLGRDVAVKRLRADALGGVESRARFAREAFALARVSDPHVLAVFDVCAEAADSYLVTDYCPDGSLADRLRQGALTTREVRDLARDVSAGLVAMHAVGIVHRDIKPGNILRLAGRWVIGDLGIARVDGDARLTQTGAVIGTPDYWAPETARGEASTQAVDIYGLGCVLFEALSGRPPFRADSPLATGLLHASAEPPPLPAAIEDEDPQLAGLVLRLLAKDPSARPTAASLTRELAAGTAEEPWDTLVYPDVATVPMSAPTLPRTVAYPPARTPRRRRVPRAALAFAALALIAALGVLALVRDHTRSGSQSTTPPASVPASTPVTSSTRLVPLLEGRSVASATAVLAERGLRLAVGGTTASAAPRGSIIAQIPAASRRVTPGEHGQRDAERRPHETATEQRDPPVQGKPKAKPAKDHGHGHGKQDKGHKGT